MDKATIYFYRRPLARMTVVGYMVLLHVWLALHHGCLVGVGARS